MDSKQKRYFAGEEKLIDQYFPNWRQQVNDDVRRLAGGVIIIELNVEERFIRSFNTDLGIKMLTHPEAIAFLETFSPPEAKPEPNPTKKKGKGKQ